LVLLTLLIFRSESASSSISRTYIGRDQLAKIDCFPNCIIKACPECDEMPMSRLLRRSPVSINNWDLYGSDVKVLDQGPFGSCTAFSARYAHLLYQKRTSAALVEPSCAFWYARARTIIGLKDTVDSGTTLSATVRMLKANPLVNEESWPYLARNILVSPKVSVRGPPLYTNQITMFIGVPNKKSNFLQWVKDEIVAGKCVVIGIPVYSNFEYYSTLSTGVVPMPKGYLLGGHAVCLTGFNDAKSTFNFVNSWGTYSGLSGHYTIPFTYVSKYTYEAFSL